MRFLQDLATFYKILRTIPYPDDILDLMRAVAEELARHGMILRSGGADGADSAFEEGCRRVNGKMEIYLPWRGFNGNHSPLFLVGDDAMEVAAEHHPAWTA